jgi:TonB family protein
MNPLPRFRTSAATLAFLGAFGAGLAAQDSLSAARDLYAGAAYEDALLVLNRLRAAGPKSDEVGAIEQYRAFCYLALGRAVDAEQAIEALVQAQPLYQPSVNDLSPRLRTAFSDVRKRLLPAIVHQKYGAAKAAYDRKEWADAEIKFKQVLEVLNDPDVAPAVSRPPLSDMKTLATGFYDLSVVAAAPPPPPPPPPVEPPPPPPVVAGPPRIYALGDPGVVPPVPLRQYLPPFPLAAPGAPSPRQGSLEVVINESGAVESAVMKVPLNATYDRQALQAARTWQYKPAMLNGAPVKFRKVVQVSVQSR